MNSAASGHGKDPTIPYIDSHNHMHSLSHDEWETMAMTGLKAAVLSSGNPYIYRELLDEPPGETEILRHWKQSLKISRTCLDNYSFQLFVAAGISAMTLVRDCDQLLEHLAEIALLPDVVAIGEVGLDPVQYFGMQWPLDDQRRVLRAQFKIAKDVGKPVILHTPTPKKSADYAIKLSGGALPSTHDYRLTYLKMDLEELAASSLDETRLIVDHTDRTIIEYILENTRCMIGISIGWQRTRAKPAAIQLQKHRQGAGMPRPQRHLLQRRHGRHQPRRLQRRRHLRQAGTDTA